MPIYLTIQSIRPPAPLRLLAFWLLGNTAVHSLFNISRNPEYQACRIESILGHWQKAGYGLECIAHFLKPGISVLAEWVGTARAMRFVSFPSGGTLSSFHRNRDTERHVVQTTGASLWVMMVMTPRSQNVERAPFLIGTQRAHYAMFERTFLNM